jgi:hypothetical protein
MSARVAESIARSRLAVSPGGPRPTAAVTKGDMMDLFRLFAPRIIAHAHCDIP